MIFNPTQRNQPVATTQQTAFQPVATVVQVEVRLFLERQNKNKVQRANSYKNGTFSTFERIFRGLTQK